MVICINFAIQIVYEIFMFFGKLLKLLVSPNVGWAGFDKYSIPNNLLLSKLFYPCLAILAISKFIPFICGYMEMELRVMIVSAMIDFIKYFVAFFMISFLITGLFKFTTESENTTNRLNNYIVLNLSILVIINILKNLVPGFPIFDLLPVYVAYVAYCGRNYMEIPSDKEKSFITSMAIFLLGVPLCLKYVFELMLPNMC